MSNNMFPINMTKRMVGLTASLICKRIEELYTELSDNGVPSEISVVLIKLPTSVDRSVILKELFTECFDIDDVPELVANANDKLGELVTFHAMLTAMSNGEVHAKEQQRIRTGGCCGPDD